jgi:hypothetical protein
MEQRENDVASKNAQVWLRKEECVISMVQRRSFAASKNAQM